MSSPSKVVDLNVPGDSSQPPEISSPEAERALLGGLMLENGRYFEVEEAVCPEDFFDPRNRLIYRAVQALMGKGHGCDNVTVAEYLKSRQKLEDAGGAAYIGNLMVSTPSAANVATYAQMVRSMALRRELAITGRKIVSRALRSEGHDGEALLEEAERAIFALGESVYHDQVDNLAINTDEIVDHLRERERIYNRSKDGESQLTGLTTGLKGLDELTMGLQAGDLFVVAAAPSLGKTALALHFAYSNTIHLHDQTVLIFSLEMPKMQLALRLVSSLGSVPLRDLRVGALGRHWLKVNSGLGLIKAGGPILVDDSQTLTPDRICSRARRLAASERRAGRRLSLIVVDYLQLVEVAQAGRPGRQSMTRAMEIGLVSRSLKSLARELKLPVIALSQLNRDHRHRSGGRLYLSDLRDSGAIEQDADVVCFITLPEGDEGEHGSHKPPAEADRRLYLAKHRNGETGEVDAVFEGPYVRFRDSTDEDRARAEGRRPFDDVPAEVQM